MTIIKKLSNFIKKKSNFFSVLDLKALKILRFNPFIVVSSLVVFSAIFFLSLNLITSKNERNKNNLKEVTKTSEFSRLTDFLISRINSPYEEISYVIKSNDTVEKILKKYNVKDSDIRIISVKLKEKKLASIYSGRKLSLIIKKLEDNTNTVISFIYPINNTNSVEIRKFQNNYLVKENILQLYKKEVVVKNIIRNNLYKSAIESGVEPNIIIEFARIFGFEVDFQRDIRKGDWFEILY